MNSESNNDYSLKIILVGEKQVGRSAIFFRYYDDIFYTEDFNPYHNPYESCVRPDFTRKVINIENKSIKVQICNLYGWYDIQNLGKLLSRGADIIILCFDMTSQISFNNMIGTIEKIKQKFDLNNVILFLAGTKCDLEQEIYVNQEMMNNLCKQYDLDADSYMFTSAKTNTNINELFEKSVKKFINKHPKNYHNELVIRDYFLTTEPKISSSCHC
jgi:small GTP-binding protein